MKKALARFLIAHLLLLGGVMLMVQSTAAHASNCSVELYAPAKATGRATTAAGKPSVI